MKALKRILVLALVVVVVGGGLWLLRNRMAPVKSASAAAGPAQLVDVRQGNLTSSITVVGELDALQSQDMTFNRMKAATKLLTLDGKAGSSVKAGQVLATIDPASYQQALDQAKSDLQAAEENLTDLRTPASKLDLSKAEVALAKARQSVEQAKVDLAAVQAPDFTTLEKAVVDAQDNLALAKLQQALAERDTQAKNERDLQYAVDWHQRRVTDLQLLVTAGKANLEQTNLLTQEQQTLAEAQANLGRVQAGRMLSMKAADAAVAKSEATLADAQEALATARAGGDKLALAKAQVALQDAQVALSAAEDSRTTLTQGADATTLAAAQADVDKKRLAVAEAQADLAGTTLVAPFDGTVLQTRVTAGNQIGASTVIMTVANMKGLQVVASVDETTIRRVTVGQNATISFDAFPGQTFRGKVTAVPLQGALQGNVMVYEVPISLTGADALPLLVGMTANVQIQTGQATNAILVPAIAIQQSGGAYQVLMPNEDPQGQPVAVPVEIGLSDGVNTQVTRGLKVGDKVLVQYAASTTNSNQNQNNRNGGILGGLFGGGFRIPGR